MVIREATAKSRMCGVARESSSQTRSRLNCANRNYLLASTALASALLFGKLVTPIPAHALTNCLIGNPPPGPILVNVADDIICNNVDDRSNAGVVIDLTTVGGSNYINLYNSGFLIATADGGINTETFGG